MKIMGMFWKERAEACRSGGSKADASGNLGLPVSTSPLMSEWIGKVLDGPIGRVLKKFAVFRHFPPDRRRRMPAPGSCGW